MNANLRSSLVMLVLVLFGTIRIEAATVLWVAPDGRDDAAGTADRPFATLTRARDAVREMVRAGLKNDVVVRLRGGTYRLAETLVLTPCPPVSPDGSRSFPRRQLSRGAGEWNHYYITIIPVHDWEHLEQANALLRLRDTAGIRVEDFFAARV